MKKGLKKTHTVIDQNIKEKTLKKKSNKKRKVRVIVFKGN